MKRKHKKYSRPKRPFDKNRIVEEEKIKKEFGLKNKKEIWRSESRIKLMRTLAKNLISARPEEQKKLFEKLGNLGFKAGSVAEILSLDKKDYLRRRLQTVVVVKKLARTLKEARQFITHRKVLIDGKSICLVCKCHVCRENVICEVCNLAFCYCNICPIISDKNFCSQSIGNICVSSQP